MKKAEINVLPENKQTREEAHDETMKEDQESGQLMLQEEGQHSGEAGESQNTNANPITPSIEEEAGVSQNEQRNAAYRQQQKNSKRSDEILPCPRCNSTDTKFCYFNNYKTSQPRHKCRACQRYWTAGGTLRNVPVGSGRGKNKNCRDIAISQALHINDARNGFQFKANRVRIGENKYEGSVAYAGTTSNLVDNGLRDGHQPPTLQNTNDVPPTTVPCLSGASWPFQLNSGVSMPAICPPGYPMPLCPPPIWNWGMPNVWNNVPWLSMPSPSPNSPLRKHSRNGELIEPSNSKEHSELSKNPGSTILVPKPLRIDNPEEAAKSSIWPALGIEYDPTSREGLYQSLQPKVDEKEATVADTPLLQANPAALSRSISFRERT